MKTLKHLAFFACCLFALFAKASAQSLSILPVYGYTYNNSAAKIKLQNSGGMHLGFGLHKALCNELSLSSGLLFDLNEQTHLKTIGPGLEAFTAYRQYNLRLPLNLLYHYPVGKNALSFEVGPYLSYCFGGHWDSMTIDRNLGDITNHTKRNLGFGVGNDQMQRLDYGANLATAFYFKKGLFFRIAYFKGLQANTVYNFQDIRQQVFHFSVGFKFNTGKKLSAKQKAVQ